MFNAFRDKKGVLWPQCHCPWRETFLIYFSSFFWGTLKFAITQKGIWKSNWFSDERCLCRWNYFWKYYMEARRRFLKHINSFSCFKYHLQVPLDWPKHIHKKQNILNLKKVAINKEEHSTRTMLTSFLLKNKKKGEWTWCTKIWWVYLLYIIYYLFVYF